MAEAKAEPGMFERLTRSYGERKRKICAIVWLIACGPAPPVLGHGQTGRAVVG
jgi:hypothetical protein